MLSESARMTTAEEARQNWDASPITFARLSLEIWEVI